MNHPRRVLYSPKWMADLRLAIAHDLARRPSARSVPLAFVVVFWHAIVCGLVLGLIVGSLVVSMLSSTPVSAGKDPGVLQEMSVGGSVELTIDTERAVALPRKSNRSSDILAVITNAAVEYGQDPARMIAVARCESSLDVNAVGDQGAAVGLWQFHLPTWTANARRVFGRDVGDLRTDPVRSSVVAAWMWSVGQSYQWTCAK